MNSNEWSFASWQSASTVVSASVARVPRNNDEWLRLRGTNTHPITWLWSSYPLINNACIIFARFQLTVECDFPMFCPSRCFLPSRKSGFFSPAFFPPESFYLIFFTKKRSRWNTNYLPRLKYVKVIGAISGGTRWKCSTSCFLNTVVLCRPLPVLRESLNVLYIFCAREQGIRGMWLKGKEL